jgi:microcystin degradation protein MlrC
MSPPVVFTAALVQETNVFGPLPTGLQSFSGRFIAAGQPCTAEPPFPEALLANLKRRAAAGELQLNCGPVAGAHPSGAVTRLAYESLRDQILAALEAVRPVDIVALHLHGAMIAEHYPDCEGDILARIRALLGPEAVIGALLDPHAHLSPSMLAAADILVAYKEYPHTDFRERADELVDLLLRVSRGAACPHASLWDAGVIGIFHTNLPDVRELVDRMQNWERSARALTVSLIHGFPWGDCADLGTRALVISDGDPEEADRLASELAAAAQALAVKAPLMTTPLERALQDLALHNAGSPVVWADSADNPGGGAPGDATYVLAALLDRGEVGVCLGPLWDPMAVDIAFNAGAGSRIHMRIGGKTGPLSGAPRDVHAEVLALDGNASQTFAGARFPLGRAAALRCAGVDVVITTERDQARGTDLFTNLGIRPEEKRLVVVKSSQHFYASFAKISDCIVYLDCPGSLQSDLKSHEYAQVARPRWPMDPSPAAPWRVAIRSPHRKSKEHP